MKNIHYLSIATAVLGMTLMTSSLVRADDEKTTSTTTTVSSEGTINEYNPDAIVVRTSASPTPVRYMATKTTTYVDESGNPISVETVKSGLPVTVYYDRDGDNLVATRVVVRNAPVVQKSTTTTTTTRKSDDD